MTKINKKNWERRLIEEITPYIGGGFNSGGEYIGIIAIKKFIQEVEKDTRIETEKAFGGCLKCYGKGYATQNYGMEGFDDFGREGFIISPTVHMNFCECDRGKQLKGLLVKEQ